jgi:CRISPR/Cas system CSM-associated protein Csm3 (group 7 of RAMP superfamily)
VEIREQALGCFVIRGTVKAQSPLHLGAEPRLGVVKGTKVYIPGSMLRGAVGLALARAVCVKPEYAKRHEECPSREDCDYFQLFQDEGNRASEVFFRNAYPRHEGCVGGGIYYPTPRTFFVCEDCGETRFNGFNPPKECPKCRGVLKPYEGYICSVCGHIARAPVNLARITRTAIDRRRYAAAMIRLPGEAEPFGTLHSRDVVAQGTCFGLEVVVGSKAEPCLKALTSTLEKALPDEGLGGGRSRGFGRVSVKISEVSRLDAGRFEDRASKLNSADFAIRLVSDALLEGLDLSGQTLVAAARRAYTWIFKEGAPRLPSVKLIDRRVGEGRFSGWRLKEDRRREVLPTVAAGSVFRYRSDGVEVFSKALAALEVLAVGGFKPMGLGQLRVKNMSGDSLEE